MQNLSVVELASWLADPSRPAPQLVDVREPWEFELGHLPASTLMPLNTVPQRWQALSDNQPIVCICHHGMRSMQAALFIAGQGFTQVYNLSGGVHAWSKQIDLSFPQY